MTSRLRDGLDTIAAELRAIKVCKRAGLVGGQSLPDTLGDLANLRRRGGVAAGVVNSGRRFSERTAIIDELGTVTYGEQDRRTNAIAHRWHDVGLRAGDGVAILARNHRGLQYAVFAAGKLGCRIIMLNTDFAGPQIREVVGREGVDLLVADEEYVGLLDGLAPRYGVLRAWAETPGDDTLEALATNGNTEPLPPPEKRAKIVMLTSGTTGSPSVAGGGARRTAGQHHDLGALLRRRQWLQHARSRGSRPGPLRRRRKAVEEADVFLVGHEQVHTFPSDHLRICSRRSRC